MSTSFSLGVVIGAAVSGSFTSAMGTAQRTLSKLTDTTSRLKTRQDALSRASERYGQIGSGIADRLRSSYDSVGDSLKRVEYQQTRLLKWDAKVNTMLLKRQQVMSELRGIVGGVTAAGALAVKATATYAGEESLVRSTSQGARNYDRAEERQLLADTRTASRESSQSVVELLKATDDLVDAGWNRKEAAKLNDIIGKVATVYNMGTQDTAKVADVLTHNLGYDNDKGTRHAFNLLADSGNRVGFEFPDVAPAFGKLAESFEKRGITGDEAITEIMSSLGAARLTMRNKEDVVSGLQGWMDTSDGRRMEHRFDVMGVDYVRSRADYMKGGMSDFEASLRVTQRYLEEVGNGQFMSKFSALNDDAAAQQQLIQSFGLGQIVSSPEQIKFINAMSKNWGAYENNKQTIKNQGDPNYLNMAYDQKADTLGVQGKQLKNELSILSSTFGEALAPVVRENIDLLKGWLTTATDWVKNNQALVQHYARLAVTAGKYFLMVRGGWLISKLVYNSTLGWLFGLVRGGWRGVATIVRLTHEYRTLGKSSSMLFNLTMKAGGGFKKLWGKMRGLGPLASRLATGAGRLGRVLGGGLLRGLMAAGRAVLFIGRALLMNPIGLLITGIAVAAYLIYRYWGPIKGFFTRLWTGIENIGTQIWSSITGFFTDRWQEIQTAFDGGLLGIGELILNWSPLGLFTQVFSEVMSWFGVDLPKDFTDFGKNIIDGLTKGIKDKWNSVKDTFKNLTDGIKGFFTGEVRIQSPSRVFMGYGGYIVEGLQLGINNTAWKAEQAAKGLAAKIMPDSLRSPRIPAVPFIADIPRGATAGGGESSPAIHLVYSPSVHIKEATPGTLTTDLIKQALKENLPELERLLDEIMRRKERRSFDA
ncbi:phage tail tape measure protein [Salmonella enterica]|uniref:Phage tail tape measure protein n=1 Tax=Salmonella enterica subsp. enterica serovar Java TaxID=224729 RepID=A0A3Z6QQP9_SALEB|nr:phage tail tape measure protein [Salmonella enterica subsp. enterica serovar Java]EAO0162796.1 phage tail tape measure protein [Salmonella enterica]ECF6068483.1 phage tail tape measure protein [Salmonella enterica subsp. diarizonae]EDQ0178841.1 phage tail tape measure protein [Salmonella enterica subsp. enterica serovar 4,[5],12:b:-]EEE5610904.1 phage tail tape measure protein [Salmonella enterica subsp. enterica serovar Typhimurium]